MLMSFSQQNARMRVKWICRATSRSSSSSAASRHSTTLSGVSAGSGAAVTDLSALKTQSLSFPEYDVTHLYPPASLQE
ncbi:mCG1050913 [Mus musculus]|nr:mCG1050913 [Mus musculus]